MFRVWGRGNDANRAAIQGWQDQPEDLARLDRALTFTLNSLHMVDRNDPVCDIVARKVIEIDKRAFMTLKRSRRASPANSASRSKAHLSWRLLYYCLSI